MKKVAVALHAVENFDLNILNKLENLDYIHVDVMDGIFVNNTMLYLKIFKVLKENIKIPIIAHLMVINPFDYINKIIEYVDAFFFHVEAGGNKTLIFEEIKKKKKKDWISS